MPWYGYLCIGVGVVCIIVSIIIVKYRKEEQNGEAQRLLPNEEERRYDGADQGVRQH